MSGASTAQARLNLQLEMVSSSYVQEGAHGLSAPCPYVTDFGERSVGGLSIFPEDVVLE